ncbi:MAG: WS/DGAT domain-containing protein, partial [Candidatus Korobacteraceae bacterium]
VLMGTSPVVPPIPRKKPDSPAPPQRDSGAQLLDSLMKSYFSAVKGALTLHSEALKIAQELMASPNGPINDLMDVVPEIASPAERLPFNVVCHGPQKFGWTEVAMSDIQEIRQRHGGTVNDVILTIMAAALRRYAELRGVHVKGRSVRIMIPVNVRGNGDVRELGNRISFLPVTIPLDVRSPQKLFQFVRERMEVLKRTRAAEFVGFAGGLFSAIPTPIWAAIGPVASQLPLSLCNIICTNIPGPQVPLYLMGRKMLSWYPYVPIGGEMGLNCAILSYNGMAYFGFSCDVGAVPDPEHLEKFVTVSCAELRKAGKSAKREPADPPSVAAQTERKRRPRQRSNAVIPVTSKPGRKEEPTATAVPPKAAPQSQSEKPLAAAGD